MAKATFFAIKCFSKLIYFLKFLSKDPILEVYCFIKRRV